MIAIDCPLRVRGGVVTLFLLFTALSPVVLSSQESDLPQPVTYTADYTSVPPIIDGELNDSAWATTPVTDNFVVHDSGAPAPLQTYAQLTYDDQYLYLAAYCQDKDIYTHYTELQSPLFRNDDLVEIFIDPDGDGKNYLELGFSASSVYYSLIVPQANDGHVAPEPIDTPVLTNAVATHNTFDSSGRKDQHWTLEARIPLAFIDQTNLKKTPITASVWRVGLFRIDYSRHHQPNEADGYYSWQPHGKFGFHRPARFAYVKFDRSQKEKDALK